MSARETPLTDHLAVLSAALPEAQRRARECELAFRRAEGDVARLRDATIDAFADGDERRAAKASKERDAAEGTTLRNCAERLEGAKRAVAKAEAALGLFARENVDGLLQERRAEGLAAAQAVEDAVEQLAQAHALWNTVYGDVAALLRSAGRDSRDVPKFPERLAELVRAARRADSVQVAPPLPGGHLLIPPTRPAEMPASPDPATHSSRL
jgi:hypothetical protein